MRRPTRGSWQRAMASVAASVVVALVATACRGRDRRAAPPATPPPTVEDAAAPATFDAGLAALPAAPAALDPAARKRYRAAMRRGRALARAGDHSAAAAAFDDALSAAPGDGRALSELGWAAFRLGQLDRARKATLESIAATFDDDLAGASLYNLGRILEAEHQDAAAAQAYRDSLARRPNAIARQALLVLDPSAPPAGHLEAVPLSGPWPSLAEVCSHLRGTDPDAPCDTDGDVGFGRILGQLVPREPWRAVRVFQAGWAGRCVLAVETPAGWYVDGGFAPCKADGGGFRRAVTATAAVVRDELDGGGDELVLDYELREVHDVDQAGDDAAMLTSTTRRARRLCGIGPSKVPSCLPPIVTSVESHQSARPGSSATPAAPRAWQLAIAVTSGGLRLTLEEGAGVVDPVTASLLGEHRIEFP